MMVDYHLEMKLEISAQLTLTVCLPFAVAIAFVIAAVLAPKVYIESLPWIDVKFLLLCVGYCFWGVTQVSPISNRTTSFWS